MIKNLFLTVDLELEYLKRDQKVEEKYLKEITDAVLKDLRKFDIVTPEFFTGLYEKKAKELNLLDKIDMKNLNSKVIVENFYKLQKETEKSAKELTQNAQDAKEAIVSKNEKMLNDVNLKMENLLNKISKLQEQVYLDELTKVYNRKYLFEEILCDDKFKEDGVITFIDLDKFKYINDNFGHIVGDKVLTMVAKMLKELDDAKVIRYGGDEFIVVSNKSKDEVKKFFTNLINSLSKKSFKHQEQKFKVNFSYGIEKFLKDNTFSDIVEKVDEIMYEQKRKKKEKEVLEAA